MTVHRESLIFVHGIHDTHLLITRSSASATEYCSTRCAINNATITVSGFGKLAYFFQRLLQIRLRPEEEPSGLWAWDFFTGRVPLLSLDQQCQSTEGVSHVNGECENKQCNSRSLHCVLSLAAQWIVIGPVCGFVCVCLWVCYHDNSKLRASILTKLGL